MTHLDPFSYPARLWTMIFNFFFTTFIEIYVFRYYWWRDLLNPERRKTAKFWASTLKGIWLVSWIVYDSAVSANYALNLVGTPGFSYVKTFCDVFLNFAFTSHSSCIFLLLSLLHSTFKTAWPSSQFISQIEFKLYVVYSIVSFCAYPIIQFSAFEPSSVDFIVVPQFIYFCEMAFSSLLFGGLIYRMRKTHKSSSSHERTQNLVFILTFLISMLILCDMVTATSLNIINMGLVLGMHYMHTNITYPNLLPKPWVDQLTCIFSASYIPLFFVVTCILNMDSVLKIYKLMYDLYQSGKSSSSMLRDSSSKDGKGALEKRGITAD